MSNIEPFDFRGYMVRVVTGADGEPRWVASDVAKILGYSATAAMTRSLRDRHKGMQTLHTPGGTQEMAVVTEAGLYAAVMKSRLQIAAPFQDWVTDEVLPTIRRTGTYGTPPPAPALSEEEVVHRALQITYRKVQELEAKVEEDAPKVAYHEEFVCDDDCLTIGTVASTLGMGEKELREMLIERGWIFRETRMRWSQKEGRKMPMYRYSESASKKNYFLRREAHNAPRFAGQVMHTLLVTAEGAAAIAKAAKRWKAVSDQLALEVGEA